MSMNRSGDQSNIIHPIKTLHCTSARLRNTTIHSSDKDVNREQRTYSHLRETHTNQLSSVPLSC